MVARRLRAPLAALKDQILETTQLYYSKNDLIWIEVNAILTDDKRLIIKGNDSGELVKKLKSKWDYEYYLELESKDVKDLIGKVETQENKLIGEENLLRWIKENYEGENTFTKIKRLFQNQNVRYKESYW